MHIKNIYTSASMVVDIVNTMMVESPFYSNTINNSYSNNKLLTGYLRVYIQLESKRLKHEQ